LSRVSGETFSVTGDLMDGISPAHN